LPERGKKKEKKEKAGKGRKEGRRGAGEESTISPV